MLDTLLLVVIPYICIAVMLTGIFMNIFSSKLRISAPATGFFENKTQLWSSVLWHYGILTVLTGHVLGALFPGFVKSLSGSYKAMTVLETLALAAGLSALTGVAVFMFRRIAEKTVSANSRPADYAVLLVLGVQIVLGLTIALKYRWGISWYASNLSGYLHDIFTLNPSAAKAAGMPPLVTAHIVGGFVLLAILPFTRLMHLLYVPVGYLFRKPQILLYYDKDK